jgi:peptidoglycan/xylan/chitin deacetylase (PgdA/CDA1 family)
VTAPEAPDDHLGPVPDLIDEPRPRFPLFLRRVDESPLPAAEKPGARGPGREILLTFDDGPDLATTPIVLEELGRRGLKAIFFVSGQSLMGHSPADRARRALLRKIAAQGHLVANHTLGHRNLCREPESIAHQIDGIEEIIAAATGLRPRLFRSPYGASCRALRAALAERGLINVGWNVDPQEWRGDSEDAITAQVISQLARLSGRGIVLLHDTNPGAVRALPRILDWIDHENTRVPAAARLRIVDYGVFLPARALPETGMERSLGGLAHGFARAFSQISGTRDQERAGPPAARVPAFE